MVATFFGEGATEEGVFHEAVNFAALKRLPVVFVCENNLYSVYSPLSVRQPQGRSLQLLAQGHGIESAHGDGNDALAVHELTGEAVMRARGWRSHPAGVRHLSLARALWPELRQRHRLSH